MYFLLLLWLAAALCGCNSLPSGDIRFLASPADSLAGTPAPPPVILLRGWRDLWSEGIDALADKLRNEGHAAAVYKESQSSEVGDALLARLIADPSARPVVLVGFSFGADEAIKLARRLDGAGRRVDLLVLIDPVTPAPVPPGVRRCVNFYQSNGMWDVFPWLRGVPAEAEQRNEVSPAAVENLDIRDRPDLLEPGTGHKTIAGNTKVHAAILVEIRKVMETVPPR